MSGFMPAADRTPPGKVSAEVHEILIRPFPPEQIGKLPRITCGKCKDKRVECDQHQRAQCSTCGGFHSSASIHLDYVGHADVTARLLEADPGWWWEPMATDDDGLPLIVLQEGDGRKDPIATLWIRLWIDGAWRPGVGSVEGWKNDREKELIGDALRNAAMRFGVALDLWSKSDREAPPEDPGGNTDNGPRGGQVLADPADVAATLEVVKGLNDDTKAKLKGEQKRRAGRRSSESWSFARNHIWTDHELSGLRVWLAGQAGEEPWDLDGPEGQEPECNGECMTGADVGAPESAGHGSGIVKADPECPAHGNLAEDQEFGERVPTDAEVEADNPPPAGHVRCPLCTWSGPRTDLARHATKDHRNRTREDNAKLGKVISDTGPAGHTAEGQAALDEARARTSDRSAARRASARKTPEPDTPEESDGEPAAGDDGPDTAPEPDEPATAAPGAAEQHAETRQRMDTALLSMTPDQAAALATRLDAEDLWPLEIVPDDDLDHVCGIMADVLGVDS